jgi:hypothetical protein
MVLIRYFTVYLGQVRFFQKLPIEVCTRRKLDASTSSGVKCGKVLDSSDNSVEFEIWPSCGWNCDPVYISMSMDPNADSSVYAPVCSGMSI